MTRRTVRARGQFRAYHGHHLRPRRCLRRSLMVVAFALAAAAMAGAIYLVVVFSDVRAEAARAADDPELALVRDGEGDGAAENPIDFDALAEENPEIYAWLSIPGAGISVPVLQSETDDEFYLTHARDGAASSLGAVFSQSMNERDFSDPVTVLYGHNAEELLGPLHRFADADFFRDNGELTVYLPDRMLSYEIVSAYRYDDRHILNSFDFGDPGELQAYFDAVMAPEDDLHQVREGVALDAGEDRILQLSTCMLDEFHGPHRFIVTAVLRAEEPLREE